MPPLLPPPRRAFAAAPAMLKSAAFESAAAALRFRAGFVDIQCPAVQFETVQLLDRLFGFLAVVHLDESESAGLAGLAVRHDGDAFHLTEFGKHVEQIVVRGRITQVADEDINWWMVL